MRQLAAQCAELEAELATVRAKTATLDATTQQKHDRDGADTTAAAAAAAAAEISALGSRVREADRTILVLRKCVCMPMQR